MDDPSRPMCHYDVPWQRKPAPPAAPVRVDLFAPGADAPAASVWVTATAAEDGSTVLRLAHEYPDVLPRAGWRARGRGLSLAVAAVDADRVMTCVPEAN